jgi:hypothetical protein
LPHLGRRSWMASPLPSRLSEAGGGVPAVAVPTASTAVATPARVLILTVHFMCTVSLGCKGDLLMATTAIERSDLSPIPQGEPRPVQSHGPGGQTHAPIWVRIGPHRSPKTACGQGSRHGRTEGRQPA